jgi:hypothetical protein
MLAVEPERRATAEEIRKDLVATSMMSSVDFMTTTLDDADIATGCKGTIEEERVLDSYERHLRARGAQLLIT